MASKVYKAYLGLLQCLENGMEFPEAEWEVTQNYDLSQNQLTEVVEMYDNQ